MECRREKGQIVIPIFYHVDPSDVRKQTGSFGEGFAGHGKVTEERVLRWRTALTEAGGLSGWHVQHGYESKTIHEISQHIFNVLNHKQLHIDDHLVGMNSRLEEITSLLHMESDDDVSIIGIYGMGGMGKTTLAKLVYNQVADQFEHSIFLSSVSKAQDDHQLLNLQKQLLTDILGEKIPHISNIDEGSNVIKRLLCSKKCLVVVDDVNDMSQLNALVGSPQWFGPGSRIIITARDKHLLDLHGVKGLYEMKGLEFEEAFQLFSWKAFRGNLPLENFKNLSERAVTYSDGHPLALEVLASFLYGKTMPEWESELQKLQREPKMGIHNVLKSSLDGLDHNEKQLFLDIACFFEGEDMHSFREVQDSCNFPETGMRVLKDRSLVHISDNKIHMHNLIQQMGHHMVMQGHPTQPGKWSRLWNPKDIHDVLAQNMGTEEIEGISFDMSDSKEMQFTAEAFREMKRLRLLRVHWDGLLSYGPNTVLLPKNFEFPSHELRYLHWDGWSLDSLPSSFNGEKLVKLRLRYSSLKHLWKENKVKDLPKLKVMDLSHSEHLVECPDVSGAASLETLNLGGCVSLQEVHPSIARLKNLKMLNLENCTMLQYFPRITGLESLEVLNLSGCSRLEKFPIIEANMGCLLELNLKDTSITELPSSIGYLNGLRSLNVQDCKSLNTLPGSICGLNSLKTLILSGCSKLKRFPEIREVMKHLENLLLDGTSVRELPQSILHLEGLVLLNLRKCKDLRSLPSSICALKSLETLIVSGCSILNRLPEDLGMLKCLRRLQAGGTAITKPPVSLVYLTNLEELSLSGCRGSTSNWLTKSLLLWLWNRENSDCVGLQMPSLSGLRCIRYLDLSDCNLMEGMMDSKLCHLDCLEVLNLSRNNMVSIPADISGLSTLRDLLVRQCEQLEEIPNLPPTIKLLDACGCISLQSLPAPSSMISSCYGIALGFLRMLH